MEFVVTDDKNADFQELIKRLDQEYIEVHGDEALKYQKFNAITVPHVVVLAIDDGVAIGCGSYKKFDLEDSIEIKRVFVEKEYRKKGIATEIMKRLEEVAVENNYKYSFLETGRINIPAVKTYEKLGYQIIENFGFLKQDDICICMKKELRSH
ncbi:MAG: GNAT family N-acetyltransferase [Methanobrevibacter sp.]|uniref:GNAT family N-acetyltransferase n=1 Tax=Methanobrevibacter sp. TaxID=66852 RepID=UPI0026E0E6A2|nr:GNAT family N-acetyltransferase [Methanobrevibacter sp.]MDO5848589.1 GNAT family N-acetyltransferase [Methanobrevibacter sp.]